MPAFARSIRHIRLAAPFWHEFRLLAFSGRRTGEAMQSEALPTVQLAFEALSADERARCVALAIAGIRRMRNHHEGKSNIRLDDPEAYFNTAWSKLCDGSRQYDLGSADSIAALVIATAKYAILDHKKEIFTGLKRDRPFEDQGDEEDREDREDREYPPSLFEVMDDERGPLNRGALTQLKARADDERTALARLALQIIELVEGSFDEVGHSPYLQLVHTEGKRVLPTPRLSLDRRMIADALGVDPTRVSKAKAFIQQLAEGMGAVGYWQLLRQSDEEQLHDVEPSPTNEADPASREPDCALGGVAND